MHNKRFCKPFRAIYCYIFPKPPMQPPFDNQPSALLKMLPQKHCGGASRFHAEANGTRARLLRLKMPRQKSAFAGQKPIAAVAAKSPPCAGIRTRRAARRAERRAGRPTRSRFSAHRQRTFVPFSYTFFLTPEYVNAAALHCVGRRRCSTRPQTWRAPAAPRSYRPKEPASFRPYRRPSRRSAYFAASAPKPARR